MKRALIIDDEDNSRKTLRNFMAKYCPEVEILDEAAGVQEGLDKIKEHDPDLIFLDIQMPDGTGFDLLEKISPIDFKVIFVTAYDQHAVKAFKYSAIDYLLKPVDPDDLTAAVQKFNNETRIEQIEEKLDVLINNKSGIDRIVLPTSDGVQFVEIEKIIRCESDSNYTTFFLTSGDRIVVTKTLKEYDELLSDQNFYRIHQSHLVNMSHVERYVNRDGGYVIMKDGTNVQISRRKKDRFLEVLLK